MKRTKADLQVEIDELNLVISNLRQELKKRDEPLDSGPASREPETEVGYLRRELAYAQGQLHQAYLTTKELCRSGRDPVQIREHDEAIRKSNVLLQEVLRDLELVRQQGYAMKAAEVNDEVAAIINRKG